MKIKIILLAVFFQSCFACLCSAQFNTDDAYISLYKQETEIFLDDTIPYTKTKTEIVFKFNSEKSITTFHNYSIYYSHFDEVKKLDVYTKNPDANGKIKTVVIDKFEENNSRSNGIFYDDHKEIIIPFFGLTVGSEAHVEYSVITKEMHFTDPMTFRSYFPILLETYEIKVPNEIEISFINRNMPSNFYTYNKVNKKSYSVHNFTATNVEEEKLYGDAPSRLWYTPHILYKIDKINLKNKTINYCNSAADLFGWYKQHISKLATVPTGKIQILADSITKNCKTENEKIETIYKWVQNKIKYVAFEAGMDGLIPREADAVCSNRYGDCKDMANLIRTLLMAVKIPAYLTSIGSRSIPYTYTDVPLKNTDNHMICAVKQNGKYLFLDATDSHCPFGLPASHIQGKQALIYTSPTTFDLEIVPVISAATNKVSATYDLKVSNLDLDVKVSSQYQGLLLSNMANKLQYYTEKQLEDFAKGTVKLSANNAILSKHTIPKLEELSSKSLLFEYSIPNYLKALGNEKYINIFMYKNYASDGISDSKRMVPVDRGDNVSDSTTYVLNIPENYKATYVPENSKFENPKFGCSINYTQNNQTVICTVVSYTNLPNLHIDPADFAQWNTFIKTMTSAYKESIILEKLP
jgi:alpha-D-ribose 1-methylphosphonate 5-phosphate C-P lyase